MLAPCRNLAAIGFIFFLFLLLMTCLRLLGIVLAQLLEEQRTRRSGLQFVPPVPLLMLMGDSAECLCR